MTLTCTKDSQIRHRSDPTTGGKDPARSDAAPDSTLEADQDFRPPSKSQRKRDMHELQELGEELVGLPGHRLARLPLEERLRDAIELAQRTTSREGRRRQLQFVGKLMRTVDSAPIRAALDLHNDGSRAAKTLLHGAENWRIRLLEEHDAGGLWLKAHPDTDPAQLELLVNGARAELSVGLGGRHYRGLFRLLRDALAAPVLNPGARARPREAGQGTGEVRSDEAPDND